MKPEEAVDLDLEMEVIGQKLHSPTLNCNYYVRK